MRSSVSAGNSHISVWQSPVPYLLGGVGAMLVLIAVAVTILAWSYFKESTTGHAEDEESNRSSGHLHNVEHGNSGKNERMEDMSNLSDQKDEMRVIVILAGNQKPTCIAKPMSVAAAAL